MRKKLIWQSWRRACAENAGHPRAAELFDRHTLPAFHDPFAAAAPCRSKRSGWASIAFDWIAVSFRPPDP